MKRVPGLDGLRAISILLVLCGHLDGTSGFYNNPAFWNHIGDIANLGVRVFFVISGYIITLLLLRETEKTGTISLKQFYIRRTLRIFPASYFFILVIALAYRFGVFALHPGDLLHGDENGVVVIPAEIADKVAAKAREHRDMEQERLKEILGPDFHKQFARVTEYR